MNFYISEEDGNDTDSRLPSTSTTST